jgi:hypothetical protein
MQRFKVLGLALLALLAIGAGAVAAASAHEFIASKVPGNLAGEALNKHKFKTKAGTVECKVANVQEINSKVVASPAKTQEVEVAYEQCEVSGLGAASVSTAKYLFSAETTKNVSLRSKVTITVSLCTVTIENSKANENLEKVAYANMVGPPEWIEVKATVTGITYKTSALCPGGGVTAADGEYAGNEKVLETGGNIRWQ